MPVIVDDAKILERAKAFLRKAEATDSPAEAETFSDAAERLFTKLGMDRVAAMAAAFEQDGSVVDEPIIQHGEDFHGILSLINARFLGAIVMAFGCRVAETHYSGMAAKYRGVTVVGHESDVEHALAVWQSLRLQADTALAHFTKTDPQILKWKRLARQSTYDKSFYQSQVRTARKNFLLNFAYGAAKRIRGNRHTAEAEVKGTGTELMLIDRSKAVERYYADAFGEWGKGRDTNAAGYGAHAGYAAGQAASTGERQFAGRRAIEGR